VRAQNAVWSCSLPKGSQIRKQLLLAPIVLTLGLGNVVVVSMGTSENRALTSLSSDLRVVLNQNH
jgi:hypothetical protein